MEKKLIVFDLDETLRKLTYNSNNKKNNVMLRPHIKMLLNKLREVQENGIDIMIYTSATNDNVQNYFIDCLPKDYQNLFCRIISRDDNIEPKAGSQESQIYSFNGKPVTSIEGYNQILFFDDNKLEGQYLKKLFDDKEKSPEKQVIFACYGFYPPNQDTLYAYKKIANENKEIQKMINEYFDEILAEPGCELMIKRIDEFQQMPFEKGYTEYYDDDRLKESRSKTRSLEESMEDFMDEKDLTDKFYDYIDKYYSDSENNINLER